MASLSSYKAKFESFTENCGILAALDKIRKKLLDYEELCNYIESNDCSNEKFEFLTFFCSKLKSDFSTHNFSGLEINVIACVLPSFIYCHYIASYSRNFSNVREVTEEILLVVFNEKSISSDIFHYADHVINSNPVYSFNENLYPTNKPYNIPFRNYELFSNLLQKQVLQAQTVASPLMDVDFYMFNINNLSVPTCKISLEQSFLFYTAFIIYMCAHFGKLNNNTVSRTCKVICMLCRSGYNSNYFMKNEHILLSKSEIEQIYEMKIPRAPITNNFVREAVLFLFFSVYRTADEVLACIDDVRQICLNKLLFGGSCSAEALYKFLQIVSEDHIDSSYTYILSPMKGSTKK